MPANPWNYPPITFPADGATVWVEMANPYFRPWQGTWDATAQTFTHTVSAAVAPWWTVARWRAL